MKQNRLRRAGSLALTLALACTLALPSFAADAADIGLDNFKAVRTYPGFPDVPEDWYANDVKVAYELGLMQGKGGYFDPDGLITLAEVMTMAANTAAIYYGDDFTPGGSPWYTNAWEYAKKVGITYEGEYTAEDMTGVATKADMAGMLAFAIPRKEFPRINRIACIPDVTYRTAYNNYIYLLYNAGVLTGDTTGSFGPDGAITRKEAAAIINRVAVAANRKSFSLAASAPGEVAVSADGSFQLSVPTGEGWTVLSNENDGEGYSEFFCAAGQNDAYVGIYAYSKADYSLNSLEHLADLFCEILTEDGVEIDSLPSAGLFRGLPSMTMKRYETFGSGGEYGEYVVWTDFVENSSNYYVIEQAYSLERCSAEQFDQLFTMLDSFDLAL